MNGFNFLFKLSLYNSGKETNYLIFKATYKDYNFASKNTANVIHKGPFLVIL